MVVNIAMPVLLLILLTSVKSSVAMTIIVRWPPTETYRPAFLAIYMISTRNQSKPVVVFSLLRYAQEVSDMSHDVRKPDFCICENKDADQLRGNREADQRLCFRY